MDGFNGSYPRIHNDNVNFAYVLRAQKQTKNKQVNAKSCRVQKTRTLGTRLIRTTYALRAIYEIPEFPIDINMNEYIINNCTLNAHVRQTNHQKANVVRRQFLTLPNNIPKIRRHRSAMQTKNAMVMFGHN